MPHVRASIRSYANTAFATLTSPLGTVTVGDTKVRPQSSLPYVNVVAVSERSQVENEQYGAAYRNLREVDIAADITIGANTNAADELDALCSQAETAMATDPTLGGLASVCWLHQTTFTRQGEAERELHTARLTWRAQYRTLATDPDTAL